MIKKNIKKSTLLIGVIVVIFLFTVGFTFAYFAYNLSNNTTINGDAGSVDLSLSVTKILPVSDATVVDDILVSNFNNLASNLYNSCKYSGGEYSTCQVYKIVLSNMGDGVNTRVRGSVSFDNPDSPNLSWIRLDNYNSSTIYTQADLGSTFNTATSSFKDFEPEYLLNNGSSVTYYLVVWVNETTSVQTDTGTFTGTVKFEDQNGKGVTSTFAPQKVMIVMSEKLKKIRFLNKYIIIAIIVLLVIITRTTYSFLAYSYSNRSVIKGNVIAVNAILDVERVVGTNEGMVPLKDSSLNNAINGVGSSNGACVDKYGNLSCQVYKITLTNTGSRLQSLKGTIKLEAKDSNSKYNNLGWRELTDTTTI